MRQAAARAAPAAGGLALPPKRSAAVYCATKAGLRTFTQAFRHQLEESAVLVPEGMLPLGDTPMTAGRGRGKISAAQAAAELIQGQERGHSFPWER